MRRIERACLWLTIIGAAVVLGVQCVGVAVSTAQLSGAGPVTISGIPLHNMPAEAIAAAAGGGAAASFDSLTITSAAVSESARGLYTVATTLSYASGIYIAGTVMWLGILLLRGRPFSRGITIAVAGVAIMVMLTVVGQSLLTGIGNAELVRGLGLESAGVPGFLTEIDLAPIGWAFALSFVAAAFELGQKMQRDTERLV